MNTTDILDKTLAWLYAKEHDATISSRILSYFLQPIGGKIQLQSATPDWGARGYQFDGSNKETEESVLHINRSYSNQQGVPPQEVEDLTQIILHTLNTNPDRFHDMAEIPGLETQEWMQRMELARYLLKQGLIEANTQGSILFIKLTIKGSMYLRTHDSAA
ncbi:MAG: hypothetical protein COW65_19320 [Cytophagales bacterium CG18_big_fil_WC_8_21_14_2_50_42_9]|nr:MAG: hypothetical protein COW65_19320 [Cytophagales bacterium CG18_big_fil_WC_8_21_14_2_50_42_9]